MKWFLIFIFIPLSLFSVSLEEFQAEILRETNLRRVTYGAHELQWRPDELGFNCFAQWKAMYCAQNLWYDHYDLNNRDPVVQYREWGGTVQGGENLFLIPSWKGKTARQLAKFAVDGWYASEGHRNNLLSFRYNYLTVGAFQWPGGKYLLVVQHFTP